MPSRTATCLPFLEGVGAGPASVALLVPSPLGPLLLEGDATALRRLRLPGEAAEGSSAPQVPAARRDDLASTHPVARAAEQLAAYFAGRRRTFELPLAPGGTAFQRQVWAALCGIPFGATISYGELAARLGRPGASRAAGGANGRNPIAIIIPCHRVVAADGGLGGFSGGLEVKARLLRHEGVEPVDAIGPGGLAADRAAAAAGLFACTAS